MSEGSSKASEIDLGDDFGDVAVKVNGARVEVRTDGSILAYTSKSIDAYTSGPVQVHVPANDGGKATAGSQAELKIGDRVADGMIYAGISPDTGRAMYTTPEDAPLTYSFNQAKEYAAQLNAQDYLGHGGWRVPTKDELNVIRKNRNEGSLKGTFNGLWHWTSTEYSNYLAWNQRFSDGYQNFYYKLSLFAVRCVRG